MAEQRGYRPQQGPGGPRGQGAYGSGRAHEERGPAYDPSGIRLAKPIPPELFNGMAKEAAKFYLSACIFVKWGRRTTTVDRTGRPRWPTTTVDRGGSWQ